MFAAKNVLLTPKAGWVTPVYDSSALATQQNSISSGTAMTWTQTAAAGSYVIIEASFDPSYGNMTSAATPTVTFGGTALTRLGTVTFNDAWVMVFGVNAISGGSGQTASVKFTQSGQTWGGWLASYTYTNVTSVGTLQTANNVGTSASVSVTPSTSSPTIVWGSVHAYGWGNNPSSFNLTARQTSAFGNNNNNFTAGDVSVSSTAAKSITATLGSNYWAGVGLSLL